MARKLTDEKLEEMWGLYKTKQSLTFVSEKSGISFITVKKYCHLLKWDKRIEKIQVNVQRRSDKKEEAHRVRHGEIGKLMQATGVKRIKKIFTDSEEDPDSIVSLDPRLAKDLIKDGIGIERDAVGDVAPDTVVVLALPVGLDNL